MASVFNSRNTTLDLDTDVSFTGRWEDVQNYVTVINTLETGVDTSGTVKFQWLNTDDDDIPSDNATPLVSDTYSYSASQVVTKQFDTRARWFRLKVEGTGGEVKQISTNYKKAPTEIKLTDDNTNIVSVNRGTNYNSLYTVLTDTTGNLVGSTNDAHTGEALYVHLADGSGSSLATTDNNRDITRTLTNTDVSFVFVNEGFSSDNSGSIIVSKNRFRLNKSVIPFKDGDIVRFSMGALGDTNFSLDDAFGSPADPSGGLKATATVRYREVEADHVQFELLVDQNMSEWFDPAVGFTNFDPSQFTDFDTMTAPNKNLAVGSDTHAYLLESSGGYVPRVDDYYAAFRDVSGFDVSAAGLSLNPGQYPMDLRFYQGSLTTSMGQFNVASFDLSLANNPLESLAVALRDNQNANLGSTGVGTTDYYYHHTRSAGNNILFLVDTCFTDTGAKVNELVGGLLTIAQNVNTGTGSAPYTAVACYNGGSNPVLAVQGGDPTHVQDSVLKPYDNNVTDWTYGTGAYTSVDPNVASKSNYWQALVNYANQETSDTCLGNIFNSGVDTIVLFSYGDSSASEADRTGYDACASFFRGVDKIVVTDTNTDVTELLTFAGTTDNIYRYPSVDVLGFDTCTSFLSTLAKRIAGVKHVGHNALQVHTSDVCGHSQAGTMPVSDAQFGDVAMYYALADSCGTKLDTTKSNTSDTGINAMYVSLVTKVNSQGTALANPSTVNSSRPLHITFDEQFQQGKIFDFTVSGHPVTIADLSNNNVNLKHMGIANETATPIWLKVYDMSVGYYNDNSGATLNVTTSNYDTSAGALEGRLVYNFAVPGLQYRDLDFLKGVKFDHGMYVVASTNYRYDSYDFPPGNNHIYVHGSYEDIS